MWVISKWLPTPHVLSIALIEEELGQRLISFQSKVKGAEREINLCSSSDDAVYNTDALLALNLGGL